MGWYLGCAPLVSDLTQCDMELNRKTQKNKQILSLCARTGRQFWVADPSKNIVFFLRFLLKLRLCYTFHSSCIDSFSPKKYNLYWRDSQELNVFLRLFVCQE